MSYWPVKNPEAWAAAIVADVVTPIVYCDIFASITGAQLNSSPLEITMGSVAFDSTQAIRRMGSSITFIPTPDLSIVPNDTSDLLFPDGVEILPWKGFLYPDGTSDVAPQGRMLIEDAVTTDNGKDVNVVVACSDRMESLARAEFTQAYSTVPTTTLTAAITSTSQPTVTVAQLPTGQTPYIATINSEQVLVTIADPVLSQLTMTRGYNGSTAATHLSGATVSTTADVTIGGLVQNRLPGVPMSLTASTSVLAPTPFNVGDDPAALVMQQALAASTLLNGVSVGMECYFDQLGTFVLAPIDDPSNVSPAVTYAEGPTCIMTGLKRTLSNKSVPNWIIVVSQGSGVPTPLRSDWQDLDPASPTYLYGDYPLTVQSVTTSLAVTQDQTDAMALALGQARLGTFDELAVSYHGDPAADAGVVASITRANSKLSGAPYAMQKGTLDLSNGMASTLTGYRVQ